jgi:hypothetical protein
VLRLHPYDDVAVDWGTVGQVTVAAIGALAAALKLVDSRQELPRRRRQIMNDLDLVDRLSPGSEARTRLEEHVHEAVLNLLSDESEKRRDPVGMVLATIFLAGAGWAAFQHWGNDGSRW